ncbi:MAG: chitinase [Chitinophagaceae bacterium]|nr:chitinase [Chitinophagaceae bacterium]
MSKIHSSFSLFFCTLCILCVSAFQANAQFKVVGYLVNWNAFVSGANAVDYTKVTHINIAFINPTNTSGTLGPTTSLSTVVGIVHSNNAKVLASLGGAGASTTNWSAVMSTPTTRTAFIATIMQFVSDYNLDGVDIDIEGDLLNGSVITSAQYQSFVVELGTALHGQNKLMTAALATWFGSQVTNTAAQAFDWINVMSYDAYGTWTGPGQHSSYNSAVSDLAYWLNKVVDKNHLVLGVPSYGYKWINNTSSGSSSIQYNTLVGQYARAVNQDSITPGTGQAIYYNGVPTIKDKTALAINNANGVMMWTLQYDLPTSNTGSLIRAIDEVIQATLHNAVPTVSITSPANNSIYIEGDTISLSADALDSDGMVDKVSFYAGTQNIGDDTNVPYSITWIGAGPGTYTVNAKAKDNAFATGTSSNITITINTPTAARSFGGPYAIPGKIEAENFDIGKDLGYHDLEATNQGGAYRATNVDIEATTDGGAGYDVGWVQAGEWLSYTVNVAATAIYNLQVRVATINTGRTFHIEMNGTNVSGTIAVPNTGAWTAFQTVTVPNVSLTQGVQAMKLVFDSGDFNVNYINFTATVTAIADADASGSLSAVVSPNPFSNEATLQFSLKDGGQTKVTISNMIGASPITLVDQYFAPGDHSLALNGLNLPSGIYLCTLTNAGHTKAVKIIKE